MNVSTGSAGLSDAEEFALQLSMLSLLEGESSDALPYAALLGDEAMISDYLQKYPNEVGCHPFLNSFSSCLISVTIRNASYYQNNTRKYHEVAACSIGISVKHA